MLLPVKLRSIRPPPIISSELRSDRPKTQPDPTVAIPSSCRSSPCKNSFQPRSNALLNSSMAGESQQPEIADVKGKKFAYPFSCKVDCAHLCNGCQPLDQAIGELSLLYGFDRGWCSIYMTIALMCGQQDLASHLEYVELQFRATKDVEKTIYSYVKDGKFVEIAALLTVAREEVTSPSLFKGLCDPALNGNMCLRQLVLSEIASLMASQTTLVSTSEELHDELNYKLERMMSILRMIEVFERVGDKIELDRRYLFKCYEEFWSAQIGCLLISEGLAKLEDFEWKCDHSVGQHVSVIGSTFDYNFTEIFEWKLYEGMQLESGTTKLCKQHDVDPTSYKTQGIPWLSNQPTTLEAIPILDDNGDAKSSLPLKVALEKLCHHPYLKDWTPQKSTFKLVCILCLPQLKKSLESIRLVACKTEDIEANGCDLVRQGKLIELAVLLMVAPEKLILTTSEGSSDLCSNVIRRCIMSDLQASFDAEVRLMGRSNSCKLVEKCKDEREMKLSALKVLEVFERAGNSVNQYLQSDAYNDCKRSILEIVREIHNLFEKAGLDMMKPRDTDLNDIKCFSHTLDPVDHASLPLALSPHEFSVAEKKHLFGMQRGLPRTPAGSRTFLTMVQRNSKSCGPWVSAPKSKAIPNVLRRSICWFLSAGVDISKMINCCRDFDDQIALDLIRFDNKFAFVRWIHYKAQSVGGYEVYQSVMLSDIVWNVPLRNAVKCATALLQGETCLKLDSNARFEIIDVFICYEHNNKTDIRFNGQLPLNIAIEYMREQPPFIGWSTTTRQSLCMMIVFCQCETEILNSVREHFRCTKENEAKKEIYRYAKDGLHDPALDGNMSLRQLVLSEIVSLMTSRITLVSTSEEVHDELNNKLETMMSMLHLIEVFVRVGYKIELFHRYLTSHPHITKVSKLELATHMACLLISEGFAEYKDFDLKRSVSCAAVTKFHKDFLELLESKLSGENRGTQLECETTKIYTKRDAGAMTKWIPRLSYQPPTVEAIPILNNEDDAKGYLPLKAALEKLCNHSYLKDWTLEKSIFNLVCILCLPQLKESLERVRLVACKTEIETIGCDLARQGKLIELASLLMVAPEKLKITTSSGSNDLRTNVVRRCIISDLQASLDAEVRLMGRSNSHKLAEKFKDEKEMKLSALLVLEVFERAGNSINRYLQSDTYHDGTRSRLEIVREIRNLLEKAGFAMKPGDIDLNDIKWYGSQQSGHAVHTSFPTCFSPTLDPVDHTSSPLALRPHELSDTKKKYLFGTQRGLPRTPSIQGSAAGSRPFHAMGQGNRKCCGPRVSAPKSKALKLGIPNVSQKSRWFLSLGIDISLFNFLNKIKVTKL
ncbi:hypothetical protein GQ457_08G002080 [Hibiscus cannabinus]